MAKYSGAEFPDLNNIEWVPEYALPPKGKKSNTTLQSIIEPFIEKLQERPGQWAVYARGRKQAFPMAKITNPQLKLYTQVRNAYDKDTETWTVYMRWTGGSMANPEG